MENRVKPCPNGCEENLYHNGFYVVCQTCGLEGPRQSGGNLQEATDLWNALPRKSEDKNEIQVCPINVVYVLYRLDRWASDYEYPWDIVGFVYDKVDADKWVTDGISGYRRYEEVKQHG